MGSVASCFVLFTEAKGKKTKWYNMVGWIALLSIVIAAVVVACLCSISQCIPIEPEKMRKSMIPRYKEITWCNDRDHCKDTSVNSTTR